MGNQFPLPKGAQPPFSAHICWGKIAGWITMPFGKELDLGPSDIVSDGDPKQGSRAPTFSAHVYYGQTAGWIKMALGM